MPDRAQFVGGQVLGRGEVVEALVAASEEAVVDLVAGACPGSQRAAAEELRIVRVRQDDQDATPARPNASDSPVGGAAMAMSDSLSQARLGQDRLDDLRICQLCRRCSRRLHVDRRGPRPCASGPPARPTAGAPSRSKVTHWVLVFLLSISTMTTPDC